MGIALSTIGIKVSYAVETTAGTRPTTGYKHIPDLKSIPSINPAPNTADATTFDNLEYTSYVQLLKDIGGALEISANFTQKLFEVWLTHTKLLLQAESKLGCVSIYPVLRNLLLLQSNLQEWEYPKRVQTHF